MLTFNERIMPFIGLVLEGFLYGIYSGIFAMYLRCRASEKKYTDKKQNVVFYSICVLYILSVALFAAHIMTLTYYQLGQPVESGFSIYFVIVAIFGCCDFTSQSILIYRCWIVWGCNIRIVIIPSILTLTFLVTWLAGGSSAYISSGKFTIPTWGYSMALSGLAISSTVNALVTSMIVFRILKVFRQVGATSNDQILDTAGGRKLRRVLLVLIESGMILFSIQLARVVYAIKERDALRFSSIVVCIHNVLNGIIPTTIAVRISMGLSFHEEKSMEEVATGSLAFAFNHPGDSLLETTSNNNVSEDSIGRRDDIGIQRSSNIDITER